MSKQYGKVKGDILKDGHRGLFFYPNTGGRKYIKHDRVHYRICAVYKIAKARGLTKIETIALLRRPFKGLPFLKMPHNIKSIVDAWYRTKAFKYV